jgi:DNA polymerase-3 subunit chi
MKIDFHILDNTNNPRSMLYVCSLVEKAYLAKQQVYIQTNSPEETEQLDNLLWTFKDDSFIPHSPYSAADTSPPTIQIGHAATPTQQRNLLINLSHQVPDFFQQFQHVIEIVFSDPAMQQLARERYKQYRDQGHEMNTVKIKLASHD